MKKLLCFLLAFSMLFSSLAASAAMSADKIPEFLDKAGIVKAGTFADDTQLLNRGEFAKLISKLVPIENIQNLSDVQVFKDIPMDSDLFAVTTLLNKMYFIVGDGEGNFEPEAPITAEAACKILVHLLGDQYFAQYYGGYIPAAANKGILSGVELSEGQTVSVKAALKMIYNTMIADISNSNMYDGNATDNAKPEMFMSKRLGIYKIEGTVTDDGVTGLTGETVIKEGQIKIGQYVFENATGMSDLLGYTVEGFYKYDSETETNTLIYAYINENRTNVIELKDADIISYANYTYKYYEDEDQTQEEELYLNTNFRLIYNGRAYTKDTAESSFTKTVDQMLKPTYGFAKLIDTNGDGYYDLVSVKNYEVVVLASVDTENYVVYGDRDYTNIIINLKGAEDDMTVTSAVGSAYEFSSLDKGDVLSIAESADGKHVEIKYSNTKITETLSSLDAESIYIGEQAYKITAPFAAYMQNATGGNAVTPGVYGTFYLTFDDRVVAFRNSTIDATRIGMLGNVHCKSAMDDELSLLILTDTSSFDALKVAEKVRVDGVLWRDMFALANHLLQYNKMLIRYRLNGDNEIFWIDTPYDAALGNPYAATESDDTLHIMDGVNHTEAVWNKNTMSFHGKCLFNTNTVPFMYYPTEEFEESYVTTFATFNTNGGKHITAYSTDTKSMFADYIIVENAKLGGNVYVNAPDIAVVLKVTDAVGDEGEIVKKLLVTKEGTILTDLIAEQDALKCVCGKGLCASTPLEVGAGDIIMYAEKNGKVSETIICYDHSGNGFVSAGNKKMFGKYVNGAFDGIGHDWENATFWADSSTNSDLQMSATHAILPVNYINRIEDIGAEIAFDFWPFTDHVQIPGGNDFWRDERSQTEVLKKVSIADMYVIRVNAAKGTFTPVKITDVKTFNNGDGIKEGAFMFWDQGVPKLLVYYK